ncbi:hypothetical protein CAC42_7135 [Sphaceloma murrayae]|uniref:Uncharacterized protein n=1 Tax=Sphaceloma murrayae TaxID=2082308 RepID=A0A2K1QQY1_9PEZI|nr:hypothetical protein CAC42_7135 [Sphaceloma murrayae]
MATTAPPLSDRKRVKVYELKNNDWYDRGTGFCAGQILSPEDARIFVQSEDDHTRTLLETRIAKDDGYQKQQDTLIVWTEPTGVDMALSFQEPEGCSAIWDFVYEVQQRLLAMAPDDLDEDMLEGGSSIMLPPPELGNLHEVEGIMRNASQSTPGRDALAKFVMAPDSLYIAKLVPLVEIAENLEDLLDLHRLCNIMKTLILLNDTSIIEFIVRDELILGVVGALEYDPDFPSHKANHRQYLANNSKFKEVVKIESQEIRRKIHHTYRLHYLKDVVLARILDDPTFSVLNSLIFFHQVDIVNHIQSNAQFLTELFAVFSPQEQDRQRKKDAVLFIQHLCAVAKNIQAASRAQLFQNFINGGLFNVLTFALTHPDAAVRVAGSDILVALIDHDPAMMRTYIFKAINEKTKPLTDTLVELLLVEQDLGVKTQMADAIKVLLDPTSNSTSMDMLGRTNGDFLAKIRSNAATVPQTETFISNFYDESAKKLFKPLKDLQPRTDLSSLSVQEASLHEHLVGILCFLLRAHAHRAKYFTLSEHLHCRVAQLMSCPQKHLKLAAIRWFRTCISLSDDFHNRTIIDQRLLEPILALLEQTSQRDNLLNSACLEFFEFIKREGGKSMVAHLVENFRPRLAAIDYVDTFAQIIDTYEKYQAGYPAIAEESSFSTQGAGTPNRGLINGGQRWGSGLKEADADEEAYFNTSDNEEEIVDEDDDNGLPTSASVKPLTNGASPVRPLVAYGDDEDDADAMDVLSASPQSQPKPTSDVDDRPDSALPKIKYGKTARSHQAAAGSGPTGSGPTSPDPLQQSPPERPAEKRRREEDEEDTLDAIASGNVSSKRRNSVSREQLLAQKGLDGNKEKTKEEKEEQQKEQKGKSKSPSPVTGKENGPNLRRKGSLRNRDSPVSKVTGMGGISISLKGKDGDD